MKSFRVAAIGGVYILGMPTVVLVARDGETWTVQGLYNKSTMLPFKVGDDVEIPTSDGRTPEGRETTATHWGRAGYECPLALETAPPEVRAAVYVPKAPPAEIAVAERPARKPRRPRSNVYDLFGNVIAYENGELDNAETLTLFSHLVRTGQAWSLQGSYGRTARDLILNGYLERGTGRVLRDLDGD